MRFLWPQIARRWRKRRRCASIRRMWGVRKAPPTGDQTRGFNDPSPLLGAEQPPRTSEETLGARVYGFAVETPVKRAVSLTLAEDVKAAFSFPSKKKLTQAQARA